VQFRVLGSFEVVHDGRVVTLSGGELGVLALVVLNTGRVVPVDALMPPTPTSGLTSSGPNEMPVTCSATSDTPTPTRRHRPIRRT